MKKILETILIILGLIAYIGIICLIWVCGYWYLSFYCAKWLAVIGASVTPLIFILYPIYEGLCKEEKQKNIVKRWRRVEK